MLPLRSWVRLILAVVVSFGAVACGGVLSAPPPPSPEEIPALEAAVAAQPADADLGLLLASAYHEAGQVQATARLVAGLRAEHPTHMGLLVMDGLLNEEAGEFASARGFYQEVLDAEPAQELERELNRRLDVIRQEELRGEVLEALAREAELSDAPDPATVGVFPFGYEGDDPQWEPLRLALAELLVTDLAVTGRLRLVERVKVQALVQELELAAVGLVEEATAARSGRILGSGRIVQGRFRVQDESQISLSATVVEVASGVAGAAPITAQDEITRLFELEKRLALDVHAELGVQLTPAERARVNERQTESVQALLAFGRGLAASDAGDFDQAGQHFTEAARIDPSFGLAARRRQQSLARTEDAPRRLRSQAAFSTHRRRAVTALRRAPASGRAAILRHMSQKQRAVLAEVLGQDRLGTAILLELVFRRPGGEP